MTLDETATPADLLEQILKTSLDGILLCRAIRDPAGDLTDFRVIRCNERAELMTGFSRHQMVNYSMLTLDPDGHATGIFQKYKQVVETGLPLYIEHYFAGGNVWMAQSLARFGDGVLASCVDISALKRAEAARQRETELLQAILDNTPTGIAVLQSVRDSTGRIVDFCFGHLNPGAERITRRPSGQLIGQRYTAAWPEARTNGVLDCHVRVAETGEPAKINGVNLPVGDYDGWYTIRIRPFGDGVIATFVDVTALKRAELAVQQQAELLRSVLDNSANPISAFRAVRHPETGRITNFRYVAHNEANRRMMNRTDDEVLGHTLLALFPLLAERGLLDQFAAVVESSRAVQFEQEFGEAGWNGWFDVSVRKWEDGIVLTLVDITAGKSHQRQLEQANRDLLRANDNLRQFAYVASHDLQEPLRKLVAFGDMLQAQCAPQLEPSGRDIINRMQSAAGRMSVLIKDVLAYSRISTHCAPFQPVELTQLMADMQRELAAELREAGATLDVGPLPTVRGDRTQLAQLFNNLLANALKFRRTDRPLTVCVESRVLPPDQFVTAEGPSDLDPGRTYYAISLTDNGVGFENKHAERIFGVFQRLHPRQQYEGTGIGLAICKRVAENHHGAITATSQPGEGATFRVYLPE